MQERSEKGLPSVLHTCTTHEGEVGQGSNVQGYLEFKLACCWPFFSGALAQALQVVVVPPACHVYQARVTRVGKEGRRLPFFPEPRRTQKKAAASSAGVQTCLKGSAWRRGPN